MRTRVVLASITCLAALLATSLYSREAATAEPRLYTLHFIKAEVPSIAGYVASVTGKVIIVDYRIKDLVTLETKDPVTADGVYDALVRAMTEQGWFVTVRRDGAVVISTRKRTAPGADAGRFITI
jgi:type II secretory pathway component GspD/PulD (secretin)